MNRQQRWLNVQMEIKVVHKAFKFRIYPSAGQEKLLSVQFGHARFVYNYFLAARNAYYLEHKADEKKILSYKETSKLLTALKKTDDHVWLKEADSQVLQSALKNLDRAFANFYAGRAKYPRFKKKSKVQSCHFPKLTRPLSLSPICITNYIHFGIIE